MEGLVAHHQLDQPAQHGIVGLGVERRERAHRQALDQHLHADDLLVDLGRADEVGQHRGDGLADRQRVTPAPGDVAREARDMARLLARLVDGVFLRARVDQDVAEAGRQRHCALLAVQQVRDRPVHDVVGELDLLAVVQPVGDGAPQLDIRVERHHRRQRHVERQIEVDIALVERVPEMVVGGRYDAVEGIGAAAVTRHFQHRGEILGRHRVISLVVCNLLGHGVSDPRGNMTVASPFSMDFSPVPAHGTSAIFGPHGGRRTLPAQE